MYRQTAELPAKGSTPVLQPLSQPPLRHSKSLQVAPEAQPAALLLVDVLPATNVAGINAPHDQQEEEGASDVQQMQQIVCGLTFEDTLNNAHTGDKMDLRSTCIHSFFYNHIHVLGILDVTLCKFQLKTNSGGRQQMPARV